MPANGRWDLIRRLKGLYIYIYDISRLRVNIHKFYMVLTLRFSVLYGLVRCKISTDWSLV